jgi:hypothetical protein
MGISLRGILSAPGSDQPGWNLEPRQWWTDLDRPAVEFAETVVEFVPNSPGNCEQWQFVMNMCQTVVELVGMMIMRVSLCVKRTIDVS